MLLLNSGKESCDNSIADEDSKRIETKIVMQNDEKWFWLILSQTGPQVVW